MTAPNAHSDMQGCTPPRPRNSQQRVRLSVGALILEIRNMLKAVDDWKKEHAPWARSEEGWDVFIWLLSARSQARPLKSLYYGSPFSENTLRAALYQYVDAGMIELTQPDGDRRQQIARTTEAFETMLATLRDLVDGLFDKRPLGGPAPEGPPLLN